MKRPAFIRIFLSAAMRVYHGRNCGMSYSLLDKITVPEVLAGRWRYRQLFFTTEYGTEF